MIAPRVCAKPLSSPRRRGSTGASSSATDQTPDAALSRAAVEHEVDNILGKVDRQLADGNKRLVALVIPVATPKHTMYLTLEPAFPDGHNPGYMLHYDNRGAGNDAHLRGANNEVYPLRTSIPATPEMRALLKTLLVNALMQRRKDGTIAGIYEAIGAFVAGVKAERGESWLDDPRKFDLPSYPQDAGDCNFANGDPGLDRRMGPNLAQRFREFENKTVRERCYQFVDRERLDAALTANEERKERDHSHLGRRRRFPNAV